MDDLEAHAAMSQALVERGLATAEQVAADRTSLEAALAGNAPAADPAATIADPAKAAPVNPDVNPIETQIYAAPDTPDGYRFAGVPEGVGSDPAQEAEVRQAFFAAGVAAPIAKEIDRLYGQALLKPPTDADLEVSRQNTMQMIHRNYGADADKVLAVARKEYDAITAKSPRLAQMAKQSGLVNNFYVISSLFHSAQAKGRANV